MEKFAGGRNVMLATGGAAEPPSQINPDIKWIFSTSLRKSDFENALTSMQNVLQLVSRDSSDYETAVKRAS
ncbi:MAG: hypothetical protein HC846_02745 [Blastocatellia bacterium]|nr:hypothetical protein [Blastocatellia bacterium]